MVEGKPFEITRADGSKSRYIVAVSNHNGELLGAVHMFLGGARSDQVAARSDDRGWYSVGHTSSAQWVEQNHEQFEQEYWKLADYLTAKPEPTPADLLKRLRLLQELKQELFVANRKGTPRWQEVVEEIERIKGDLKARSAAKVGAYKGQPEEPPIEPQPREAEPAPAAAPHQKPKPEAELHFRGLSGSVIDGRIDQWGDFQDGTGRDVAHATVKRAGPTAPLEITITPARDSKLTAEGERWVRWLIARAQAGLPVNLDEARLYAKNWRERYEAAAKKGNRQNVPRDTLAQYQYQAAEALPEARKWEKIVEELEDGPPASWKAPIAAEPAPTAGPPAPGALTEQEKRFLDAMYARLKTGTPTNNLELAKLATEIFGGGRQAGAWSIQQVYDLVEGALAKYLTREGRAWTLTVAANNPPTMHTDEGLQLARRLLALLPRQGDRAERKDAFQQYSTPPTIAMLAAFAANPKAKDTVLEPSAGTGMLAAWMTGGIHLNEIDPHRRAILEYVFDHPKPEAITGLDAEQFHNLSDLAPTVVVMNPPFSAAGSRGITKDQGVWKRHVEQALAALTEGGRLVAVLPGGTLTHGGRDTGAAPDGPAAEWWKGIEQQYNVRANLLIPGKEYGKFGTTYDVRLVVIDKTGPTPSHPIDLSVNSLEEAFDALKPIASDRPRPRGDTVEPGQKPGGGGTGPRQSPTGSRKPGRRGGGSSAPAGGVRRQPGSGPQGAPAAPAAPRSGEPAPGPEAPISGGPAAPEPRRRLEHKHPPVELGENLDAQAAEDVAGGTFVYYQPAKIRGGAAHPAPIVQSAPLAAVDPPDITYRWSLPDQVIDEGKLSNVQLEAVAYAGQRHERILADGTRAGFFIGDGTGVGKGREISGIIVDNWQQGRKRTIWVSASTDLIEDAKRDLRDLGFGDIPVHIVNEWKGNEAIDLPEGVVFTTYSSLIGESAGGDNEPAKRRLDQLANWVANDGLVVFDEAHKAKNAWDAGEGEPTQTGRAVLELQEKLPQARVVYSSATGATDPVNMAYMTRLGLWGTGTPFKTFGDFLGAIEAGGVGAMEMVSRDLKARGAYLARTLAFDGVTYRETFHKLTDEQRHIYDTAAKAWLTVIQKINEYVEKTNAPGRAAGRAAALFWAAHQRFFKQMITALKVPSAIAEIQKALDEDKSVIVSVMATGEAQQERLLAKMREQGGELEDIDFSPRELLDSLIVQTFPVHAYEEKMVNGRKVRVPVLDEEGNHVIDKEALAARERLRDSLTDIALPDNPIDQIIAHFGADTVAELTGRKQRIEKGEGGKKQLKKRKAEGVAQAKINLAEQNAFQDGTKRIALISDAASTGISLHADARAGNQQQRVHIALELKWSADKQLQDFGRSHRSNQVHAPEYVLLSTDIGGERRFSATIARRLASLGALTQGERKATSGGEIAKYNFESTYGRDAATRTITEMARDTAGREVLADMGLLARDPDSHQVDPGAHVRQEWMGDVPRFLNRVLSLDLPRQARVFDRFAEHFANAIAAAKAQGTFDEGVTDIRGLAVRLVKQEVVREDPIDGTRTRHYQLEVDEHTPVVTFKDAQENIRTRQALNPQAQGMGFYRQKRSGNIVAMLYSGTETDTVTGRTWRNYALIRPTGTTERVHEADLAEKYEPVSDATARPWWDEAYRQAPKTRTREVHILGGSILSVWNLIDNVRNMDVVRVTSDKGERVVGLQIPAREVGAVLRALGLGRELVDPASIFRGVVQQGEEVQLAGGLTLRRTRVHGEDAAEVVGATSEKFDGLRDIGLTSERIDGKLRFFLPTDETAGLPILERLLERYPVIGSSTGMDTRAGGGSMNSYRPRFAYLDREPEGWEETLSTTTIASGERPAAAVRRLAQTARLMPSGIRGTPPVVYANADALKLLSIATAQTQTFRGVMAAAPLVQMLIARLDAILDVAGQPALQFFRDDLERYLGDTKALVIVGAVPGDRPSKLKQRLRHELFHAEQLELETETSAHVNAEALLAHPLARRAVRKLAALGYDGDDANQMAAEIGAHLAAGPLHWKRALGLGYDDARELFRYYIRLLREQHGDKVLDKLRFIAPQLNGVLRDARQAAAARLRQGSPQQNLAPGGGREVGQLRPGVREALPAARFDLARVGRRVEHQVPSVEPGVSLLDRVIEQTVLGETRDDLRRALNPTARGESAQRAGLSLREHAAQAARDYALAEKALEQARKLFSARTWEQNLDFINRVEANEDQGSDGLNAIAEMMRRLLDEARERVQSLGTGKLTQFYQYYFPHIWKRPNEAENEWKRILGRRPIEGPKAFLKKRKFASFQEGFEAGLLPVSENPVDLVLLKLKEMGRYLLAHRFLREMRAAGLARFVPVRGKNRRPPEGWKELPDPLGTVWGNPVIQVPEALDREMVEGLARVAERLGIDARTVARMRGQKWGYAVPAMSAIRRRFAGPESVIIHEIGHILDQRYRLQDLLVKIPPYKAELQALADLRTTAESPAWFERYVRKGEEKIANMVAIYVHNRERMRRVAPHTYRWFDHFVRNTPELAGLADLEYGMQLKTHKTGIDTGGLLIRGHYFMPEDAAQVVKNFLSPGLNYKSWYRALRTVNNSMLQFALGFSAFHAGFTTMDAMTSKLAIAIEYAAAGRPREAVLKLLATPLSPVTNLITGTKLYRAYEQATTDPEIAEYVQALIAGGGRVKMDEAYRTKFRQRFLDAWRAGKYPTAALTALPMLPELAAWGIMEWLVPRQKLGVFADLAEFELQRLGPNASKEEIRAAMARAWDSVDNRMGQIVYDDLLWNRTVKDLAMITVQSLGWNLGTFRELLGGGADWARFAGRGARYAGSRLLGAGAGAGGSGSITGEGPEETGRVVLPPEVTHRMAYTLALPLLTAMIGMVATYLATGEGPKEWRDYFFPRTGGFDEQGHPERLSLPGYMKDVVHWWEHPLQAARNKLAPLVRWASEMLSNQDFYGVKIRNGADPAVSKALELARHAGGFFRPFAWSNYSQQRQRGAGPAMRALPFIGVTAAPSYINQTAAQQRMAELLGERSERGGQERETFERARARRELARVVRQHSPEAGQMARELLKAGTVTPRDLLRALASTQKDPDLGRFEALDVAGKLEVYRLANPEERRKWRLLVVRAFLGLRDRSPDEMEALRRRYGDVLQDIARSLRKAG